MHITHAQEQDAANILALQRLAYQSEAALYPTSPMPPLMQTLEEMRQDINAQCVLLAKLEERTVGSVRAREENGTVFIGRLIVHPAYQNRSIGTQLLAAAEQAFPAAARYELFTGHRSAKNLALYQKRGYTICRTQEISPELSLVFLQKLGAEKQGER